MLELPNSQGRAADTARRDDSGDARAVWKACIEDRLRFRHVVSECPSDIANSDMKIPLFQVKMLARTTDPEEQALLIIVHRIPYTVAVGAMGIVLKLFARGPALQ